MNFFYLCSIILCSYIPTVFSDCSSLGQFCTSIWVGSGNCAACWSYFTLDSFGRCWPNNCVTCAASLGVCTLCDTNYYAYNGRCYNPCPTTTFASGLVCAACPSYCDTCTDSNTCTVCSSGYKLYQGQCYNPCPVTTFPSGVTCQNCPSNCDTCSDSSTCTACSFGYYLYNSVCYNPCPITTYISGTICTACGSNCNACMSSSFCTTCTTGYYLYSGVCYNPCPTKTYRSSSTACSNCPNNCDTCSSSSVCTVCSSGYRLYLGQCYNPCPVTTYPASTTACHNCPLNCDTCLDSSTCTACSSGWRLYRSQCYSPCPVTTFAYGSICKDCPNDCDVCSDENTCTTCSSTYYLYKSQCLSNCPVTTYTLGTNCLDCSSYCDTCVDSNTCTVCTSGYYFYQNKCFVKCPSKAPYLSPTVTPYFCFETCPTATPYNYENLCLAQCPDKAPYLIDNVCETQSLIAKIAEMGNTAASTASTILIARSVTSFSNPSLFMFGSLMKLLEYTRYMNISHSDNLEILFQTIGDTGDLIPMPSMSNEMQNALETHPMPDVFEKYDFPSNFMLNEGDDILALLTILGLFVLFRIMQKGVAYLRNVKTARSLVTNARFFFQNYVIGKFYEMLGDVSLASVFEFKTFSSGDRYSWLSLTACISCLVLGVTLYGMNFWIIYARRKREGKALKEFSEKYKGAEVLFDGFKDESFLHQAAMLFFVARGVISSQVIALGYTMPLFQSAILLILSFFMVVYYFLIRPMKEKTEFVEQLSFEILLLMVNSCFFIQAMCDMMQASTKAVVKSIGQTVIVLNTAFKFLPLIFLAVQFGLTIWKYYKLLKAILKSEETGENKKISNKLSSSTILGSHKLSQVSSDSSFFGLNNLSVDESMIGSQLSRSPLDLLRNRRAKISPLADDDGDGGGDSKKKKTSAKSKSSANKTFSAKKNINPSIILMKQLADSAKKTVEAVANQKKEGQIPGVQRAIQIRKRIQKSNVSEDL